MPTTESQTEDEGVETAEPRVASQASAAPLGEVLSALPVMARVAWFAMGALLASVVTLLVVLRPWQRGGEGAGRATPYEGFPFADNAGVCQEYVAVASFQGTYAEAQALSRRLAAVLPSGMRAENLRLVRAFAPGERWTVAVDAQSGVGNQERAAAVAAEMNAVPGTGVRFEPVFYTARRLYDTARVLCMPRATATP